MLVMVVRTSSINRYQMVKSKDSGNIQLSSNPGPPLLNVTVLLFPVL